MKNQTAYNMKGNIIKSLTNGKFGTSSDRYYNIVDIVKDEFIIFDLGEILDTNKLKIAGGNARFGGGGMPKYFTLETSSKLNGPWTLVDKLKYSIKEINSRASAEAQIIKFKEVATRYVRLTFISAWSRCSSTACHKHAKTIVLRQIKFLSNELTDNDEIEVKINKLANNIVDNFTALNTDRKTLMKSKRLLIDLESKGVNVTLSISKLQEQIDALTDQIIDYENQYENISKNLQKLSNDMKNTSKNVGNIDYIDI